VPAPEAVRFSAERFAVGGLAYDAVSHRFVFGDRQGRKLIVVSEGSNHAVDLVRADSAGFQDISAIEIDAKRGDLWVASAAAADGAGMLHRLQLVSRRRSPGGHARRSRSQSGWGGPRPRFGEPAAARASFRRDVP
jgi:hypothetical protein